MIELYYWPTPNGHKVTMFLEEAGLQYRIHPVDISAGDQFDPGFLAISPNNRMPPSSTPILPTAAIRSASLNQVLSFSISRKDRPLPAAGSAGAEVDAEWLFWQVGGLGPMAGQNHHFGLYAPEKIPYSIKRYVNETNRLYGVLDRRLATNRFLAGDSYTIADMAAYPWIVPWKRQQQSLDAFPSLRRWFEEIGTRPATRMAYGKGEPYSGRPTVTEQSKAILFGQTAATAASQ
jgi:GST-like protein